MEGKPSIDYLYLYSMNEMLSKYVHLFQADGAFYLYNSQNSFFSEISQNLFSLLSDRNFSELSHETYDFLKRKLVLVDRSQRDDYYLNMKFRYYAGSFSTDELSLVLVPTTGCNFACPYCFEKDKRHSVMSDKTIDKIISFINGHKKAKRLNITWYGGEPLMGLGAIKKIYSKLLREISIPLSRQGIITNGYLLSRDVILFLKDVGVSFIQITLDGVKENHNKTRMLLSGGRQTYDTIISNIESIFSLHPECRVSVRVNINKENIGDFSILYQQLNERWNNKDVYIYPGFIREDTKDGLSLCSRCIVPNEHIEYYLSLKEQGVNVDLFPRHCNSRGCIINTLNSYIIGPDGEVYKCWNDVSNKDKIIGNIGDDQLINEGLLFKYACDCSPFEDKRCEDCSVFPICQGGCGWYRFRNKYENGDFDICSIYKDKGKLEKALLLSLNKTNNSKFPVLRP
jgi:radical SAM domain protein